MRITIHDVAREAGVSLAAVSRAMNERGEVSPAQRARILEVARRLHYVPSSIAQSLVLGKTKTLGVMVTDNASPIYAEILKGIEGVAVAAGFSVLLCNSANSPERAKQGIEMLTAKRVDAMLLTPVQEDREEIRQLEASGIPFVLLLRHFHDEWTDYVITDNFAAGRVATAHLIDQGHRRIAHIGGPVGVSSAEGRLAGYRRALAEYDIPFDNNLVTHGFFTVVGGTGSAHHVLDRPDPPTAIFAATDLQAVGVLKAARERGLRVPTDLALVGGDDIELAAFLEPPLTTFHQPSREIGARGAEILLEKLSGVATEPQHIVFQSELIIRRSSGCKQ